MEGRRGEDYGRAVLEEMGRIGKSTVRPHQFVGNDKCGLER